MLSKEDIIQRHVDIPSGQTIALGTLTFEIVLVSLSF